VVIRVDEYLHASHPEHFVCLASSRP
jgi:hypothetical protein